MKFKDIAKAWYDDHRQYVKESTAAAYYLILSNHVNPWFGEADCVTEEGLQKYVNAKIASGMSVKSVQDSVIVVKMVLKYGAKRKWCDAPVEWKIVYPARCKDSKRLEAWSPANQRKMIDHCKAHFSFRNLGLLIAMETGMRIGEVSGLRWGDFDLQDQVVRVQRTVERIYYADGGEKRTEIKINSTKTINSNREIPLSKDILKFIRPLSKVCDPDNYVLSNEAKPLEPRTYRSYFIKLCEELGVPRIKFHGIRHTFATSLIASKCDIKTVSSILGHADVSTTLNLYVHPDKEQKRRAINAFLKGINRNKEEDEDFDISQIL